MTSTALEYRGISGVPALGADEWKTINHQATVLADSKIVPTTYRGKPGDIIAAALTGRDLGLSVIQSLNSLHVIEGKVGLSAELMVGLVRARGHSITVDVFTDDEVKVTGTRHDTGDTLTFNWTKQHTADAGLAHKQNWKAYWRSMAWARTVSQLCRALWPDILLGVGYNVEELAAIGGKDSTMNAAGEVEIVEATATTTQTAPAAQSAPAQQEAPRRRRKVGGDDRCTTCDGYGVGANDVNCPACEGAGKLDPAKHFIPAGGGDGADDLGAAMDAQDAAAAAQAGRADDDDIPFPGPSSEPEAEDAEVVNEWSDDIDAYGFEYDRTAPKNDPALPLSDDVMLHLHAAMIGCGFAGDKTDAAAKANGVIAQRGAQLNAWGYAQMRKMRDHVAAAS